MPLHGFLVFAQHCFRRRESAQIAFQCIQEKIDLPGLEPTTLHFSGQQLLNELIELGEHSSSVRFDSSSGCSLFGGHSLK